MEYYSRTQIYNLKHPLSQPSHTHVQSWLCLYSYISLLFYLSTVVKLVELRPVEDWVDVSRLMSWVLRVTMVLLELYIISLGLAQIHTVWGDSSFILPTEGRLNKLGGGISLVLSVLYRPNKPSRGRGSVLSIL